MSSHPNGSAMLPLFGFGGGIDATSLAMGHGATAPGSGMGAGMGMGMGSGMQAAGMGAAGGTFAGGAGGHRPQSLQGDLAAMPQGGGVSLPSITIRPAMKGL